VTLAGFYGMVAGFLNATRVQREPGTPGWPGWTLAPVLALAGPWMPG